VFYTPGVATAVVLWAWESKKTTPTWTLPLSFFLYVKTTNLTKLLTWPLGNRTLLLTQDSQIFVWGNNGDGQLGLGDRTDRHAPVPLLFPFPSKIVHAVCGAYFSVAVDEEGSVWTWGSNTDGQLGRNTERRSTEVPQKVEELPEPIVDVACGWEHVLSLSKNGNIYVWGRNEDGKLGIGDKISRDHPVLNPFRGAKKVTCAGHHSFAIDEQNNLYGWGWNERGNLGQGRKHFRECETTTPELILQGVEEVCCGWGHNIALLEDGTHLIWGLNRYGQLGLGDTEIRYVPQPLAEPEKFVGIFTTSYQSFGISEDGKLWMWGNSDWGKSLDTFLLTPTWIARDIKFMVPIIDNRDQIWECITWVLIGRTEPESPFSVFPVEILFNFVDLLFNKRF
jgi:alpha-tubulin suppressor-like RCC1 family protein